MTVKKLLGITQSRGVQTVNKKAAEQIYFAENPFDFGNANLYHPESRVYPNALGDPTRGTMLYGLC